VNTGAFFVVVIDNVWFKARYQYQRLCLSLYLC
jgi:hypothetical protein